MKKTRKLLSLLLALLLVFGMASTGISVLAAEFAPFAIVGIDAEFKLHTTVFDYGQRVDALVIQAGLLVKADSVDKGTFGVNVKTVNPNTSATFFEGSRVVTDVYVNNTGKVGERSDTPGSYIVVEMEVVSGRDAAGAASPTGSETYTGNVFLNMEYKVTQLKTYEFGNNTADLTSTYTQAGIHNAVVDEFVAKSFTKEGQTLNYQMFSPKTAGKPAPAKGYPLVLFLHGGGEGGTDNKIQLVANKGATVWAESPQIDKNPAYVIAPQTNEGWTTERVTKLLLGLLDELCADSTLNIDVNRVYVQGMSMGGIGTWNLILTDPKRFAAAMPLCGMVPEEWYTKATAAQTNAENPFYALRNMPISSYVAANDFEALVTGTSRAVNAVRAFNGGALNSIQLTRLETWTAGSILPPHHCWERAYMIGTAINFMFYQSRERSMVNTATSTEHDKDPRLSFTSQSLGDGVTVIQDYELGQMYVIEKDGQALIIDSGMGPGNLFAYIKENVLVNKEATIDYFLTHNHGDHTVGSRNFTGQAQIRYAYTEPAEINGLNNIDAAKRVPIRQYQTIPFAGEQLKLARVVGHTNGSLVLFYKDKIFTGDAFGSGDLWFSINTIGGYAKEVDRFISILNAYKAANGYTKIEMLPGHNENKYRFFEDYISDMALLCRGLVNRTIPTTIYTRQNALYGTRNLTNVKFTANNLGNSPAWMYLDTYAITVQDLQKKINLLDKADYTAESWAALQTAFDTANNYNVTISQGNTRIAAVKAAIAALVPTSSNDTLGFDLVTEVYPHGQEVKALIIDTVHGVNASFINTETLAVSAKTYHPRTGALVYDGARPVTKAYVSDEKALGDKNLASGRYIVLELAVGFDNTYGSSTLIYQSYNMALNMKYTISQRGRLSDFDYVNYFAQVGQINEVVDDFAYGYSPASGYNYRFFTPAKEAGKKYPLVVWLHGSGERFTDVTRNEAQILANQGGVAWAKPATQAKYPSYVLAPQSGGWTGSNVIALIDEIIAANPDIDQNRIYIAGCSMGGSGTWNTILTDPDKFAAAITCPGGNNGNAATLSAVKDLPLWMVQTGNDTYASTLAAYNTLTSINANVKWTHFDVGGNNYPNDHWSWVPTLQNFYSEEHETYIFDWLFKQTNAMTFEVVSEVFEYGQDTTAVIIDAGKEVSAASINKDTFTVTTDNKLAGATVWSGEREVLKAYVSDSKDVDGAGTESGRYIILELKRGFTVAGATTLVYNRTVSGTRYSGNHRMDLNFAVTQNAEFAVGGVTVRTSTVYEKVGEINPGFDEFDLVNFDGTNYRLYQPESDTALPLVLWNHGAGETYYNISGKNNEGMPLLANMGGVGWLQDKYPSYVLVPQRGTGTNYSQAKTIALIDSLVAAGKVDPNRVYVAGCSAGGGETLTYLANYPTYFAASVPVCPAGGTNAANLAKHKDVPMWFFHSADDASVNVSNTRQKMAILEPLNPLDLKYTEVPNMPYTDPDGTTGLYQGHWSWILPLNNYYSAAYKTNVHDWLFSQSLAADTIIGSTGEIVIVPITVKGAVDMAGFQGSLRYDESLLTLESITAKKGFSLVSDGDSFVVASEGGVGLNGDVIVGYAIFRAKAELNDDVKTVVKAEASTAYNSIPERINLILPPVNITILGIPPVSGDVTLNGEVDLADAILLMQYLSGNATLSAKQLKAADVNKDGKVNVGDVTIIMQMCL